MPEIRLRAARRRLTTPAASRYFAVARRCPDVRRGQSSIDPCKPPDGGDIEGTSARWRRLARSRLACARDARAPAPLLGQQQLEHVVDGDDPDRPAVGVDAPASRPGCSRSSAARPRASRPRRRPSAAAPRRCVATLLVGVGADQVGQRRPAPTSAACSSTTQTVETCCGLELARAHAARAPRRRSRPRGTETKSGFISPPAVDGLYPSRPLILRCLAAGSRLRTGSRRSCSISSSRSAASSLAIRESTAATSWSERSRRNSTWCSSSSSSNTSASSSLSCADRLEDLLALLVRGGLDQVGDLRRVQAREPAGARASAARSGRGRRTARCSLQGTNCRVLAVVAAEAPRQQAPADARRGSGRSRPRARPRPRRRARPRGRVTRRAVSTLIRLRSSTSARSSTSPGRRSNWARLSFVVEVRAASGSSRCDPVDRHEHLATRRSAPSGRSPAAARRRGRAARPRPRRDPSARRPSRAADCPPPMTDG